MLDRNIAPKIRPLDKFALPEVERITLDGGVQLLYLDHCSQPVTRLDLVFGVGYYHEDLALQAPFTINMLRHGTGSLSEEEIARRLDFYGASIETTVYPNHTLVTMYSMNRFLGEMLPLLMDLLTDPTFEPEKLETYRQGRFQNFLVNSRRTSYRAQINFKKILCGNDHPLGQIVTAEDYRILKRDDIIRWFHQNYDTKSGNTCMGAYAFGSITPEVQDLLKRHLGCLRTPDQRRLGELQFGLERFGLYTTRNKRVMIEMRDCSQKSLRMGCLSVERHHKDYNDLNVLVTLFGGYFSSRLMKVVREEKGYTYGISAELAEYPDTGLLVIGCDFAPQYQEQLVEEVYHQMDLLKQNPCSEDELELLRNYLAGTLSRSCDSVFSLADMYMLLDTAQLPRDYYEQRLDALLRISPERLMNLARQYFCEENIKEVLAG